VRHLDGGAAKGTQGTLRKTWEKRETPAPMGEALSAFFLRGKRFGEESIGRRGRFQKKSTYSPSYCEKTKSLIGTKEDRSLLTKYEVVWSH